MVPETGALTVTSILTKVGSVQVMGELLWSYLVGFDGRDLFVCFNGIANLFRPRPECTF